jgi:hypothetical protein
LKKFLYLEGFFVELSQLQLGNTLMNYNTNIAGLDFLGFFIRQYKYKTNLKLQLHNPLIEKKIKLFNVLEIENEPLTIIVHPSKNEIKMHMDKLKKIIKNSASSNQENLIFKLSNNIRPWSYYYHIISNKKILEYFDYLLFKMLWRWCCRRHPSKNKKWIKYKYFHRINGKKWVFGVYKNTSSYIVCLPSHSDIKLVKF